MIVDLCKPVANGDMRTVRIVMTVYEAREMLRSPQELIEGIKRAIDRNDQGFEGKEVP